LGLWLTSLYCASQVFMLKRRPGADLDDFSPESWLALRQTYSETMADKLVWLQRAYRWLIVSFGVVLLLLLVLAFLPTPASSGPTQIIILTPTPLSTP
jgi:hypothetical protein